MVNNAVSMGLAGTLDALFATLPTPTPPVKYLFDGNGAGALNDPGASYGATWVYSEPYPNNVDANTRNKILAARSSSLYAWTFLQMHNTGISLQEKMALFWHNHFVVADTTIPHREYLYYKLIRNRSLGNFKTLTEEITVDTSMLLYLSGSSNTNSAPNENYSRELLELFAIGKGPIAGAGDYTNYTEEDVVTMAKVLTGWRVSGVTNPNTLTATFNQNLHTSGSKTLSYRFNNQVIAQNGAQEYKDLIDVIFQQQECSRFIMRKLYRWFVASDITPAIETNVIEPLAETIRDNNYEIAPALMVLFASQHFFEMVACMIKSPVDLIMSVTRGLEIMPPVPSSGVKYQYEHAYNFYVMCSDMDQALFHHPNVAGWRAYYQAPLFYKQWINNFHLPKRHEYCRLMVEGGITRINNQDYIISSLVPVLQIVNNISNANDPNILIEKLAKMLFNYPITSNQLDSLKDILIPGLPDFEWTVEYVSYQNDPTNAALQQSVENKLRNLFSVMVRMSEFQIM